MRMDMFEVRRGPVAVRLVSANAAPALYAPHIVPVQGAEGVFDSGGDPFAAVPDFTFEHHDETMSWRNRWLKVRSCRAKLKLIDYRLRTCPFGSRSTRCAPRAPALHGLGLSVTIAHATK
jgi:hypothetical protein